MFAPESDAPGVGSIYGDVDSLDIPFSRRLEPVVEQPQSHALVLQTGKKIHMQMRWIRFGYLNRCPFRMEYPVNSLLLGGHGRGIVASRRVIRSPQHRPPIAIQPILPGFRIVRAYDEAANTFSVYCNQCEAGVEKRIGSGIDVAYQPFVFIEVRCVATSQSGGKGDFIKGIQVFWLEETNFSHVGFLPSSCASLRSTAIEGESDCKGRRSAVTHAIKQVLRLRFAAQDDNFETTAGPSTRFAHSG